MNPQELIEHSLQHDALFCGSSDKIDKTFLEACAHLDIISQFAAGYDNIDSAEATKLGIPVGFTPGAMNHATAATAFGLMIACSRKMFYMHKKILSGEWGHSSPTAHLGIELRNKTLGVFGLGRIGTEMAKLCQGAFGMNVLYHGRTRNPEAERELKAEYVDFGGLLAHSDVLSVHCALTPETRGIFNESAFSQMKPGSIFINTSRGLVHNETDLIAALRKGLIWGAGLDVTNPEPMSQDNPLLRMENVAVLPHIGSATIEARGEMARLAAENIIEFYKNGRLLHSVNPEVLQKKNPAS